MFETKDRPDQERVLGSLAKSLDHSPYDGLGKAKTLDHAFGALYVELKSADYHFQLQRLESVVYAYRVGSSAGQVKALLFRKGENFRSLKLFADEARDVILLNVKHVPVDPDTTRDLTVQLDNIRQATDRRSLEAAVDGLVRWNARFVVSLASTRPAIDLDGLIGGLEAKLIEADLKAFEWGMQVGVSQAPFRDLDWLGLHTESAEPTTGHSADVAEGMRYFGIGTPTLTLPPGASMLDLLADVSALSDAMLSRQFAYYTAGEAAGRLRGSADRRKHTDHSLSQPAGAATKDRALSLLADLREKGHNAGLPSICSEILDLTTNRLKSATTVDNLLKIIQDGFLEWYEAAGRLLRRVS